MLAKGFEEAATGRRATIVVKRRVKMGEKTAVVVWASKKGCRVSC